MRRTNLKAWFEGKTLPEKEKSYLSQLINGKASFGERAARRLEIDYSMGANYLDQPVSNVATGSDLRGMVPLISFVQAGAWAEAADPYPPGEAENGFRISKRMVSVFLPCE